MLEPLLSLPLLLLLPLLASLPLLLGAVPKLYTRAMRVPKIDITCTDRDRQTE
jgi:hypothetical protein